MTDAGQKPTADAIELAVCDRLNVTPEAMRSRTRHARVVMARSLAAYLMRELLPWSYPDIARYFGRHSHSTDVERVGRIEALRRDGGTIRIADEGDRPIADVIGDCRAELNGGNPQDSNEPYPLAEPADE